jgi:geranylgeranyl pyrophosphate synthase
MSDDLATLVRDELLRRIQEPATSLDAVCAYALEPTGKLLRPVLLLESALAVGGSAEAVLPAAIGIECAHVASLVHDDILDNDEMRRARESVPHRYDLATALLAGDLLFFHAVDNLLACRDLGIPAERLIDAAAVNATACRDLCQGEYQELELVGSAKVSVAEYLDMVGNKTAALFRTACQTGGILGGGAPESIQALADFGENLGIAFQVQDDLLPYLSDQTTSGKPVTSDLDNQRLTLPIILAYEATSAAGWAALDRALDGSLPSDQAHVETKALLTETGALDRAHAIARDFALLADKHALHLPPSRHRENLRGYTELTITRRS